MKMPNRPMRYTGPVTSPIQVIEPNFGWVKYAVTVAIAIALRFLCCG